MLLLVKADLVQGAVVRLLGGVIDVDQVLHLAALDEVFFDDLLDIFGLDAAVERAVRIDDDHGAGSAQAKAARAHDLDFLVEMLFLELLLKQADQLMRTGRRAAGAAADQHVCAIELHRDSSYNSGGSAARVITVPRRRRWCIRPPDT